LRPKIRGEPNDNSGERFAQNVCRGAYAEDYAMYGGVGIELLPKREPFDNDFPTLVWVELS